MANFFGILKVRYILGDVITVYHFYSNKIITPVPFSVAVKDLAKVFYALTAPLWNNTSFGIKLDTAMLFTAAVTVVPSTTKCMKHTFF